MQDKSTKLIPGSANRDPVQFRYTLASWVSERRSDGWYIARSWFVSAGEKPKWEGPYPFPQEAAIAIARYLCAELSNRHMSKLGLHQVKLGMPLYGLPKPPDLRSKKLRAKTNGVATNQPAK